MADVILWIAVVLIIISSAGMLLSRDWRWSLGLLTLQYFGMFWLLFAHWPITMAAAVLVAGWMACAILGMTYLNFKAELPYEDPWSEGWLFRIFAAGLVLLVTTAASSRLLLVLPDAGQPVILGGAILISLGLLHLGMTLTPLRVISGLLTCLGGFLIFFSVIENSILVSGFLSVIILGLALSGAYLIILNNQENRA